MLSPHCSSPHCSVVTVCGCGTQGRVQLAALAHVMLLKKAYAYARNPEVAENFSEEMSRVLNIPVIPTAHLNAATRDSNIVVTCTSANKFFLQATDIAPGTFVAAIGADRATKQEIEPKLMVGNKVVVDILEQASHIGELHHAIEQGLLTKADVHAELGQIISGQKQGRVFADEIIVFDSTGTALQDVAVAAAVYERALQTGKGICAEIRN
jgi:alanine dehydrogenase